MAYTLSEVTESVGTITLDHERRRNALSHHLVEEVITALRSFQEAKVRVVILRAKASKGLLGRPRYRRAAREPPRSARLG